MNAYHDACKVEDESMEIIFSWLRKHLKGGHLARTKEWRNPLLLQKTLGDIVVIDSSGRLVFIEVKAECEKTGNFFLETWSNLERYTPGWLHTSCCDRLYYYFLNTDELYIINLPKLRAWAFHKDRIHSFKRKEQRKREQPNNTAGRIVPIKVIKEEVGFVGIFNPKFELAQPEVELV